MESTARANAGDCSSSRRRDARCRGLIASQRQLGRDVTVVAVTDGEHAYEGVTGLGPIRREEQAAALCRLGVTPASTVRLELTDSNVAAQERELVDRLMELANKETHIVAPWTGDFHPDHEACGRAAECVARRTGATLTYYFFWTWHRGTLATLRDLPLRSLPLYPDLLKAKLEALAFHKSQLGTEWGEPILPDNLLAPARRPFEIYAVA